MKNPPDSDDTEMHQEVDWLKPSDRPIVREIASYGGWIKPASLTLNVPYGRQHVADRCRVLANHGLLERYDDVAAYRVTERGIAFLEDRVDANDLDEGTDREE